MCPTQFLLRDAPPGIFCGCPRSSSPPGIDGATSRRRAQRRAVLCRPRHRDELFGCSSVTSRERMLVLVVPSLRAPSVSLSAVERSTVLSLTIALSVVLPECRTCAPLS